MSRRIGVSVISLIPFSLGKNGLKRASLMAHKAGFHGIQILPLRGWEESTFFDINREWVISFELAWNYGSLPGAIMRHLGMAGEEKPLLHDWLLFGDYRATKNRAELIFQKFQKTSMFITHDTVHAGAMEMHPEREMTAGNYALYPHGLVWDTEHVIRPGRHGEPPITDNWENLLEEVKYNIRLIHVKNSAPPEMLKALAENTSSSIPVIFEDMPFGSTDAVSLIKNMALPPLGIKERMIAWLKGRRNYLNYFFG